MQTHACYSAERDQELLNTISHAQKNKTNIQLALYGILPVCPWVEGNYHPSPLTIVKACKICLPAAIELLRYRFPLKLEDTISAFETEENVSSSEENMRLMGISLLTQAIYKKTLALSKERNIHFSFSDCLLQICFIYQHQIQRVQEFDYYSKGIYRNKASLLIGDKKAVILLPRNEATFIGEGAHKTIYLALMVDLATSKARITVQVLSLPNQYQTLKPSFTYAEHFGKEDKGFATTYAHTAYWSEKKVQHRRLLVQEYWNCRDLFVSSKDESSFSFSTLLRIAQNLGRNLHSLHSENIYHGDVKLQNCLYRQTLKHQTIACLTDFDYLRKINPDQELTIPYGTVQYCAPEILLQKTGWETIKAADMYALGLTLLGITYGGDPFWFDDLQKIPSFYSKKGKNAKSIQDVVNKQTTLFEFLASEANKFPHLTWVRILSQLLNPNPIERITANDYYQMITQVDESIWQGHDSKLLFINNDQ